MFVSYVELHCHSAYSFLDGASHPVELAGVAAEQGHSALALTDHDGLHGAMEMAQALKPLGIHPITGAEVTLDDGTHLTLLCETREGYTNLCRLLTASHWPTRRWAREGFAEGGGRQDPLDGEPSIAMEQLEQYAAGLVCLSGCAHRGAVASRVEADRHAEAAAVARRLAGMFGRDGFRIELQRPFWRHDRRRNRLLAELAGRLGVPTVATGNVHVHARERIALQDAMVAVGLGKTLDETEPLRRGNSSHVLAPPERMAERFREHPDAVEESGRLAERLRFDLTEDLGYRYPGSEDPDADSKLAALCRDRFEERYGRSARGRREAAAERCSPRGRRPARRGAAGDPPPRAVRLLPAAPRHARAGARGGRGGARAGVVAAPAAAGARTRVERVLDRLLPHRPVARRPDRERAAPRPLPERGADRAAGHRPRLPARHPRRADPARARPLRA